MYTASARTKAPVESGQIFHIECSLEDAKKMIAMLEIQWALIRLAAMSGAAEALDHGFLPPPGSNWNVVAWLVDQVNVQYDPIDTQTLSVGAYPDDAKETTDVAHPEATDMDQPGRVEKT